MIELLRGTRVLECGSLLCGDTLGGLLGALGADVVKIEAPRRGDYLRDILGQIIPHHSPAHLQFNAHKRSVSIDLTKDAGVEVFWRLLEGADIFVDGNLATACDQLGIGYDAQRARRPSIIYCQYTGLGASGPYAPIPTHGYSMNALAGDLPAEIGEDGLMHQRLPVGILPTKGAEGTNAGAVWAAYAAAAALVRSLRTGEGCYLDVSAADAVVASVALAHSYTLNEHRLT
jgi:crotonobetainyl-CoA:carnitine CoA-transferase CaiB-like acyl-CoA transferase